MDDAPPLTTELLIPEVMFSCAELEGLDEPVELFAVDEGGRHWPGRYWRAANLEAAMPVPHGEPLPEEGGTFPCAEYVGPELARFAHGDPEARPSPLVAELAAWGVRSRHMAEPAEYAQLVARLCRAGMATP